MTEKKGRMAPVGLVTIDVEPDNVWARAEGTGLENIRQLPRFQALCQEYGVRPTYLVSYSVAANNDSAAVLEQLLAQGDCEIGMHPHLWEIPPFLPMDRQGQAWPGPAYPASALTEKLTRLRDLLVERFGAVSSHRAGRYGLDSRQVALLISLGITADTSVTPGIDWTTTGAPDFRAAPLMPYLLANDNVLHRGDSQLLEVPCTVRPGVTLGGFERTRVGRAVMQRLGRNAQWLRGSPQASSDSLTAVCAWASQRTSVLNLMTHSSELCPGASPYWPTAAAVTRHFALCEDVFRWWREHGVVPLTLKQYRAAWPMLDISTTRSGT